MLLVLMACGGAKVGEQCSETKTCEFGSVCIDSVCVSQSCSTSDQCGIEKYCNEDRLCASGCAADTDCMFGDSCDLNSRTCVAATCTDSRLDCSFGEFCAPSGECYEAGGYFCMDCEDDGDCGGNGNICYGGYCSPTCEDDTDCPNGFECYPWEDSAGNVVSHQCYTDCGLYGY